MQLLRISLLIASLSFVSSLYALAPLPPLLDKSAMNTKVSPCDDFYEYACGNWIKNYKMPADKTHVWKQGDVLENNVDETLNQIITGKISNLQYPYMKKVKEFYRSCMNESALEKNSQPLVKKYLSLIDSIQDIKSLTKVMAELRLLGVAPFFAVFSEVNYLDATHMALHIKPTGVQLPEKKYYFSPDKDIVETRKKYVEHVSKVLSLAGYKEPEAKESAQKILDLETSLEKVSLSTAERDDPHNLSHMMKMDDFKKAYSNFDWNEYFKNLGINTKQINVQEPKYFDFLNSYLSNPPWPILRTYISMLFLEKFSAEISQATDDEDFAFWFHYMEGQEKPVERWKRCTRIASSSLNEAVGQAYVKITPNAKDIKTKALSMLKSAIAAFSKNFDTLTWFDVKTRAYAKKKLQNIAMLVGYPEKWRNYDKLNSDPESFIQNFINVNRFEVQWNLSKIDKKTERYEWNSNVWENNAFNIWEKNAINFPLGILVPPNLDFNFTDFANWGALGPPTMGHELTHGYDSGGSQFDINGTLKDWWTPNTKIEFKKRTQCLIDEGNSYKVKAVNMNLDGNLILTENIADHGGMKIALQAIKSLKAHPEVLWEGFNEKQQFFLAYAQSWCSVSREASERNAILTDEHPTEDYRTNAVLWASPEFAEAFSCKKGQPMAPEKRCSVW